MNLGGTDQELQAASGPAQDPPVGVPPLPLGAVAVGFGPALRVERTIATDPSLPGPSVGQPLESAIGADEGPALRRAMMQALDGRVQTITCRLAGEPRELIVRLGPDPQRPGSGQAVWFELTGGLGGDERARSEELRLIADSARELARSMDASEVRLTACRLAISLSSAEAAILFEPSATGLRAGAALGVELSGLELPLDEASDAVSALRSGTPQLTGELAGQPPRTGAALRPTGLASVLWQPLGHGSGTQGVLAVGWRSRIDTVHPRSARLMELIAVEAGVAIDRARRFDELAELARTDPLTGLPNRRAWDEALERETSRAARERHSLSVAMVDLDGFKAYNDARGHAAGDRLLQALAARWQPLVRRTDVLARVGGDEFALLLPRCGVRLGERLLSRLRDADTLGVGFCAGIVSWDRKERPGELFRRADRALYSAKTEGPGTILAER